MGDYERGFGLEFMINLKLKGIKKKTKQKENYRI